MLCHPSCTRRSVLFGIVCGAFIEILERSQYEDYGHDRALQTQRPVQFSSIVSSIVRNAALLDWKVIHITPVFRSQCHICGCSGQSSHAFPRSPIVLAVFREMIKMTIMVLAGGGRCASSPSLPPSPPPLLLFAQPTLLIPQVRHA